MIKFFMLSKYIIQIRMAYLRHFFSLKSQRLGIGGLLLPMVVGGGSACSMEESETQFGTRLEITQSSCQSSVAANAAEIEEAELISAEGGTHVRASLWFNCAAGEICAEEKREKGTSSLDLLFFPCQEISESFAKCTCMIDVQAGINIDGVSRIRVLKQGLRHPGQTVERTEIVELQIGPETAQSNRESYNAAVQKI